MRVWRGRWCVMGLMMMTGVAVGQEGDATAENSARPEARRSETPGKIAAVTLYRGQALVSREVPIPGPVGLQEVVVTGLPMQIVQDSLFAEGTGVEVRAVRYRTRAVETAVSDEVKQIDDQIAKVQQQIAKNQQMQQLHANKSKYLDKLEGYVGQVGKEDLQEATLDAESLQKLTTFLFQQRQELLDATLATNQEAQDLQEQITLLQRRRAELSRDTTRTLREAILFVNRQEAGNASVRLNYLVNQAGWSPAYNVRATTGGEAVRLEYHAVIQQLSGERWNDVELTLSTATPALSSATPGLAPFRVSLSAQPSPMQLGQQDKKSLVQSYEQFNNDLQEANIQQNTAQSITGNFDNNWRLNNAANGIQIIELLNSKQKFQMLKSQVKTPSDTPTINYRLDNRVSLESRSDQQMVRILERDLPAEFYHVATPVLSNYVFREVSLKNTSANDLLGGPVTVYLDDRFVGRNEIPTVARGEAFVVGLGADSQLRARRELVEKKEDIQGGNREMTFTYRLVFENFKGQPVLLRVYDRMPVPVDNVDINVRLTEEGQPLSEDAVYQRKEKPRGILRWDVEVPAGAADETATDLTYSYLVEFDRQFHLSSQEDLDEQRQEFRQLEQSRGKF